VFPLFERAAPSFPPGSCSLATPYAQQVYRLSEVFFSKFHYLPEPRDITRVLGKKRSRVQQLFAELYRLGALPTPVYRTGKRRIRAV